MVSYKRRSAQFTAQPNNFDWRTLWEPFFDVRLRVELVRDAARVFLRVTNAINPVWL
jgi:hypothetical protein